jgi:NADH:flavin oxidoreductase / NADH oxidase family
MTDQSVLAAPLGIGSMTVAGRLFKSATSETRATADGFVTDELLAFYEPMVEAGTPMIITGNLYVSPQGKSAERQAGIDADDKVPGLRDWTGWPTGTTSSSSLSSTTVAGSAQAAPGVDRLVSTSDIREPLYGTKPSPLRLDEMPGWSSPSRRPGRAPGRPGSTECRSSARTDTC